MSDKISFDGVELDAEVVRAKLAEYEATQNFDIPPTKVGEFSGHDLWIWARPGEYLRVAIGPNLPDTRIDTIPGGEYTLLDTCEARDLANLLLKYSNRSS